MQRRRLQEEGNWRKWWIPLRGLRKDFRRLLTYLHDYCKSQWLHWVHFRYLCTWAWSYFDGNDSWKVQGIQREQLRVRRSKLLWFTPFQTIQHNGERKVRVLQRREQNEILCHQSFPSQRSSWEQRTSQEIRNVFLNASLIDRYYNCFNNYESKII